MLQLVRVELVLNEVRDHSFEMLCKLYGMTWMILFFVIEYANTLW